MRGDETWDPRGSKGLDHEKPELRLEVQRDGRVGSRLVCSVTSDDRLALFFSKGEGKL